MILIAPLKKTPLRWAAAFVAIGLMIVGLLWLQAFRKRLGDYFAVTPSPAAPLPTTTSSPSASLSQASQSPTPSVRSSGGPSSIPLTFTLLPGNIRQGQSVRTITKLSGQGDKIRLNLAMDADTYDTYQAILLTGSGQPIWLSPRLKASRGAQGEPLVQVLVPARLLSDGNYTFLLSGSKKAPSSKDPISQYLFKVTHD